MAVSGMSSITTSMNRNIRQLMGNAWKIVSTNPSLSGFMLKTMATQVRAASLRTRMERQGIHVPPFLIVSVTNRCNLKCKGCYSAAQHRPADGEMTEEQLRDLLTQAKSLGVSFALLAGGEPLVRPEVLKIAGEYSDIIFPVFTNGMLLDEDMVEYLRRAKNVIPIVSLEGDRAMTDDRRGSGVYSSILDRMAMMREKGVFFGASITVTSANFKKVTHQEFVSELIDCGSHVVFYIEYVPVDESTQVLALSDDQRQELAKKVESYRKNLSSLFISFPGDEEEMGGCLAAGRGFVHISARGEVEPCPFAPWSDASIKGQSLVDALRSPFLAAIRDNHDVLGETTGGCALWAKRDIVQTLLHQAQSQAQAQVQPQSHAQ